MKPIFLEILPHSVKKLGMMSEEEIRKISDKKCFSDLCCIRGCCQNAHPQNLAGVKSL